MSTSRRGWSRPESPAGPTRPDPWVARPAGDARQRALAVLGAVAAVGVAVAGLVVPRWDDRRAGLEPAAYDGPPPPVTRAADGAFVMAWGEERTPLLEIFTDYQCRACRDAHEAAGRTLKRLASQGRVRVVYRPVQFFWGAAHEPSASNSRRAANAALCAPPTGWLAYHDALFAHQPGEGVSGFTVAELIALGEQAGIFGSSFPECVTGGAQSARLDELTRYAAVTRGVREPPAAFLDGRPLDRRTQLDAARIERAVHAAHPG
jgi:protein-disulfide isomerase